MPTRKRPKRLRQKAWDPQAAAYADLSHPEWIDGPVPVRFWDDPKNHRRYMRWLAQQLQIRRLDDWYQVTSRDVRRHHGVGFLKRFDHCWPKALAELYPKHPWQVWRFVRTPAGFWDSIDNCRLYLESVGRHLKIRRLDDWYQVGTQMLREEFHGQSFLKRFDGYFSNALQVLFPEHEWHQWRFNLTPRNFWEKPENQLRYLTWLEQQLGFQSPEDWHQLKAEDLTSNHGTTLFQMCGSSPLRVAKLRYPNHCWNEWLFPRVPLGFWENRDNRLRYMAWLGKKLGYKKVEHWYRVSERDFFDNAGHRVLSAADGTILGLLQDTFPDHDWLPWRLSHAPGSYWKQRENRVRYVRWLGEQLGFQTMEDWYRLSPDDFKTQDGGGLAARYYAGPEGTVINALRECFPQHDWKPWLLKSVPPGYWQNPVNRRKHLRWMGKQLGYRKREDWYGLTQGSFHRFGASSLWSAYYQSAAYHVAKDLDPKYPWRAWLFKRVPKGFWDDPANRLEYLKWLGDKLGFRNNDDWYRIRSRDFYQNRGQIIYVKIYRSSLLRALREYRPKKKWDKKRLLGR